MVFTMSKTYVQVAQTHLPRPLGRVTEMFTMTDIDHVQELRDDVSNKVDTSKDAIKALIREEERKFNESSAQQIIHYNQMLDAYGGETEEITTILDRADQISNEVGMDANEVKDDELTDWGTKRR